jgi:hypothetical protein
MAALVLRVRGEFVEMPGLRLTAPQAARLFGVAPGNAAVQETAACFPLRVFERGLSDPLHTLRHDVRQRAFGDLAQGAASGSAWVGGSLI